MMRRYVSTDIPEIQEFLKDEPHLLIRLEAGLRALDLLYFDVWVARDEQEKIKGVLFRSYGDFYVHLTQEADLQEIAAFLGFMPMLYSLSGEESFMQELLPMLQRVRSTTICTVARQQQPPEPLAFRLLYEKTERTEDFRMSMRCWAGRGRMSSVALKTIILRGADCRQTKMGEPIFSVWTERPILPFRQRGRPTAWRLSPTL